MKEKLKTLVEKFIAEVKSVDKEADLMNVKSKYLGKNSELVEALSRLREMSIEDKKIFGVLLNNIKKDMEEKVERRLEEINNKKLYDK